MSALEWLIYELLRFCNYLCELAIIVLMICWMVFIISLAVYSNVWLTVGLALMWMYVAERLDMIP